MNEKSQLISQLRIDHEEQPESTSHTGIWLAIAAAVVAALAGAGGWWFFSKPEAIAVSVGTARISVLNADQSTVLDATGYVVARRNATVSSKVTGKVVEVMIEEGMQVEKDQIVARLDDSNLRRQFELAQSELVAAQTRVQEAEARLTEAELNLSRNAELAGRKLVSQAELDAARALYETLKAQLSTRRADVTTARRNLALQQQNLDDMVLRAPFDGVVVAKNAQPGEMISPVSAGGGFTRTGICSIVDMSSLEVEVDVNEAYIQRVFPQQPVQATLEAYPDWKIPAKVVAIVPTADRQKATVKVRIGFDELDVRILPDMGVKVAFLSAAGFERQARTEEGIQVPQSALIADNEQQVMFVVVDNVAQRRAVEVGRAFGRQRQILSGLKPGESYVVEVPSGLRDGAAVEIN